MTEDRDYRFLNEEYEQKDTCPIEILRGKYRGVVYRYLTVSGREPEDEDGDAVLSFRHEIVKGKGKNRDLAKEPDFHRVLGDILVSILVANHDKKEEFQRALRNEDTEEFVEV